MELAVFGIREWNCNKISFHLKHGLLGMFMLCNCRIWHCYCCLTCTHFWWTFNCWQGPSTMTTRWFFMITIGVRRRNLTKKTNCINKEMEYGKGLLYMEYFRRHTWHKVRKKRDIVELTTSYSSCRCTEGIFYVQRNISVECLWDSDKLFYDSPWNIFVWQRKGNLERDALRLDRPASRHRNIRKMGIS